MSGPMCILGASMYARLALLFVLYMVQGLPYGFQVTALPVYLREGGASLTIITLTTALALPWALKALWAPWVDRDTGHRFGRRRIWILPMQVLLLLTCLSAALVPPELSLAGLLGLVLVMNLCTATMDIAVDGLAVDTLEQHHLGYGNIAQVVGYKLGMITSGGLLLAYSDHLGWAGMFACMAALVAVGIVAIALFREPVSQVAAERALRSARGVFKLVMRVLSTPSARALLVLIVTYKLGESMADALFKPFLVDSGFTRSDIGLWLGTYGMVASITGSVLGGFLATRWSFTRAVAVAATVRVLPIAGEFWLTQVTPSADMVIVLTACEHFTSGALTTAMFALMMSRVDRRIGAAHYTMLATVEVLGKGLITVAAGPLGDSTSYATVFAVATLLSVGFLALLAMLAGRIARTEDDG